MIDSPEIHVMMRAAGKVSYLLVRDFNELAYLQSSRRGASGFVQSANGRSRDAIVKELSKARPGFSFDEKSESGPVWLVNPICGLENFARGIPQFATSIAIISEGSVTAGLVLDPLRGDCFNADTGRGAFLGDRNRLRVSGREDLRDSVVSIDNVASQACEAISESKARLRCSGAIALDIAYLAAGKYDVVIAHKVSMRDIASGLILTVEAGGFFNLSDAGNGTYNLIAASSPKLVKNIATLINFPASN
jgi:myo-inositol-1(or 4)-monophosphatase